VGNDGRSDERGGWRASKADRERKRERERETKRNIKRSVGEREGGGSEGVGERGKGGAKRRRRITVSLWSSSILTLAFCDCSTMPFTCSALRVSG